VTDFALYPKLKYATRCLELVWQHARPIRDPRSRGQVLLCNTLFKSDPDYVQVAKVFSSHFERSQKLPEANPSTSILLFVHLHHGSAKQYRRIQISNPSTHGAMIANCEVCLQTQSTGTNRDKAPPKSVFPLRRDPSV